MEPGFFLAEASARKNPGSISSRVAGQLQFGDTYRGLLQTEDDYNSISTSDMRDWWRRYLTPGNARIYVGGDITLEAVLPMLESRLGPTLIPTWEELPQA